MFLEALQELTGPLLGQRALSDQSGIPSYSFPPMCVSLLLLPSGVVEIVSAGKPQTVAASRVCVHRALPSDILSRDTEDDNEN